MVSARSRKVGPTAYFVGWDAKVATVAMASHGGDASRSRSRMLNKVYFRSHWHFARVLVNAQVYILLRNLTVTTHTYYITTETIIYAHTPCDNKLYAGDIRVISYSSFSCPVLCSRSFESMKILLT